MEYQLYLQENNLDPEYLDYLASKAENPCQDFLDCDDGWHDEWGDEQLLRELNANIEGDFIWHKGDE